MTTEEQFIKLPELVYDTTVNEEHWIVDAITLRLSFEPTEERVISYDTFVKNYDEYINPKDLRIRALEEELRALKLKHKPARKTRRVLLDGELVEIKELINQGIGNTEIGKEYGCSDSTISRIRVAMKRVE